MKDNEIRNAIRKEYGSIARQGGSCCGSVGTNCDTDLGSGVSTHSISETIGYSKDEIASVPKGSNLGLGCGNPLALGSLRGGETVLDLGSGAGFDCFLAAELVGEHGHVIGVDMTPAMVEKARENAQKGNYQQVEFRLGEIENLPVANSSVDLIISNCVINLSIDKERVFKEACRVLKPGGKLMISDIVLLRELPKRLQESIETYVGCISGAILRDNYLETIRKAGFEDIRILSEKAFGIDLVLNDPVARSMKSEWGISDREAEDLGNTILSISVSAVKPN